MQLPKLLRRFSNCSLYDSRLNCFWRLHQSAFQTCIWQRKFEVVINNYLINFISTWEDLWSQPNNWTHFIYQISFWFLSFIPVSLFFYILLFPHYMVVLYMGFYSTLVNGKHRFFSQYYDFWRIFVVFLWKLLFF